MKLYEWGDFLNFNPEGLSQKRRDYDKKTKIQAYLVFGLFTLAAIVVFLLLPKELKDTTAKKVKYSILIPFAVIALVTFFYFIFRAKKHNEFARELNSVVGRYVKDKNAKNFEKNLFAIKSKPVDFNQEFTWYFDLSTALHKQGKVDEALEILNELKHCSNEIQLGKVNGLLETIREEGAK